MSDNPVKCYIGIGSNLGDPLQQVRDVIPQLGQIRKTSLLQSSSLYLSVALSDIEQQDYINAVACLQTSLTPDELLIELQAIEQAYYRQRAEGVKWGPRSMDLDILLYDGVHRHDSHLHIPHPEIRHRLFVLLPLQEINPQLYVPGLGSISYLVEHAPPLRIRRIDPD